MAKEGKKAPKPAGAATIDDVQKALAELTQTQPERSHLKAWTEEAENQGSHRGAAILLATMVENTLDIALIQTLNLSKDRKREMFKPGGIFGDFGAKIIMGHAANIYGKETRNNLTIIRLIRNVFAHAKIPLSFDTPAIAEACELLSIPKILAHSPTDLIAGEYLYHPEKRERYHIVCNLTGNNLMLWNLRVHESVSDLIRMAPAPPAGCKIVAIGQPLP